MNVKKASGLQILHPAVIMSAAPGCPPLLPLEGWQVEAPWFCGVEGSAVSSQALVAPWWLCGQGHMKW